MSTTRGETYAMAWAAKQGRSKLTDHPRGEEYDIEVPRKPELKTSRKKRRQKRQPQTRTEPRDHPEIPTANEWEDGVADESLYFELFVKQGTGQTPISAVSMDDWFEDMYQSQLSQSSALGEVVDEEDLLAAFDLQMQLADPPGLSAGAHTYRQMIVELNRQMQNIRRRGELRLPRMRLNAYMALRIR